MFVKVQVSSILGFVGGKRNNISAYYINPNPKKT